ncbi:trifunctional glycosyltransferase/class I SAM-dependent methyltransferase/polysaccharide deacetylase [Novosphingobium album (ex Hu et al. 2023)]|uniref:Chitooligosaccharide deacetylase n=1 Tax=Novosphingobium album (ex Hu et al. 2023) TaxID=2930093 RepID=A0ABT0B4V5_9SPHN|nr:trifunctional glycosyltransferase/class I SAM-dependent methyltransferase/polysaccharide deacetylase [Novosphingobium album (ex Hu et al. 2023)]MCJ2180070.1 glycosyltransferase [Novosphingobium album (ex Hu et al. 2023)]
MPSVSVIIPAYNASATIDRTVESLLRQTMPDWEALVIDDGSTDSTATTVQRHAAQDPRIKLTKQKNAGASAARNTGLAGAQGTWIQFLDADDELSPDHFAVMLEAAQAAPQAGLLHCGWRRIRDNAPWWTAHPAEQLDNPFAVTARSCPFAIHAAFTRSETIRSAGGFDSTLRICEDWDLWQRIARMGTVFRAVPDLCVDVHVRAGSLSSDLIRHLEDGLRVVRVGHQADPRINCAAPAHAEGEPAAGLQDAVWSHALWVAGAAIGRNIDPVAVLARVPEPLDPSLDAGMASSILEDAMVVGAFATSPPWPELWPRVDAGVRQLANWLDEQDQEANLGSRILSVLSMRILDQVGGTRPLTIGSAHLEVVDLGCAIRNISQPGCERLRCVVLFQDRELCRFDAAIFGGMSGEALAAAIRARVDSAALREDLARLRLRQGPLRRWKGRFRSRHNTIRLWRAYARACLKRDTRAGRWPYANVLDLLYDAAPAYPGLQALDGEVERIIAEECEKARSQKPAHSDEARNLKWGIPGKAIDYAEEAFWEHLYSDENPWDYKGNAYEAMKYGQTLALTGGRRFGRALELACAEGEFTKRLAEVCDEVLATDISEAAVERAGKALSAYPGVTARRLNLLTDDIPGTFDLIVCSEVLYYLPDLDAVCAFASKAAQHLNPGGLLVMANANLLVDDPDVTGFNWAHTFGGKTIGDAFTSEPALALTKDVRMPLYRLQCFERVAADAPPAPEIRDGNMAYPLPRRIAEQVVWRGGRQAPVASSWNPFPVLMYHRIADDGPENLAQWRTSPSAFAAQLAWLRDNGFTGITLERLHAVFAAGEPLPERAVVITFDDATRDFMDSALPLLHRFGFPSVLYVPTRAVGKCADWDSRHGPPAPILDWTEIASLAYCDVTIGAHSVRHVPLTGMSPEELVREMAGSKAILEARLEREITSFAYPFGAFDPAIRGMAARCGYSSAVTCVDGLVNADADALALCRQEVRGGIGLDEFAVLVGR